MDWIGQLFLLNIYYIDYQPVGQHLGPLMSTVLVSIYGTWCLAYLTHFPHSQSIYLFGMSKLN